MRQRIPIALLISDIHLSLTAPACRADTDWMEVQAHYLDQVKALAKDGIVICAGDIFDRWNPTPELINFALKNLPEGMLCVPGQHDLPNHLIGQMDRSGYGVLKQVGHIKDLSTERVVSIGGDVILYGAGWNQAIQIPDKTDLIKVAVIHKYCWSSRETAHVKADNRSRVSSFAKSLKSYDIAVFGDNHNGFTTTSGDCLVYNCGALLRRKSDELNHRPAVGILLDDGSVERHPLDVSIDRFHELPKDAQETGFDISSFVDGLSELGEQGMNFEEVVKRHLETEDLDPKTKKIILRAMERKS